MVEVSDKWLLAGFTLFGASAAVVAVVMIPGVGVVAAVVGPSMTTTVYGALAGVLGGSTAGVTAGALTIGGLRGKPPTAASGQQMARLHRQMADDLQICRALILSAAVHCDVSDGRALARKRILLGESLNALGQAGQVPEMAEAIRRITRGEIEGEELERALGVIQPGRATCEKVFHAAARIMTDGKGSLTDAEAAFLLRLDRLNQESGGSRMCEVDADGRIDVLAIMVNAKAERETPIPSGTEDAHLMDVFPDEAGRTPGERVVGHILTANPDETGDHERWIDAFRELAVHGGMAAAPWRHRHAPKDACGRFGLGTASVTHAVLLRTGVDIIGDYLSRLDAVSKELRGRRLGVKGRLARYRKVSLLGEASIRTLLGEVCQDATAIGAFEIGHLFMDYLEVAEAGILTALRCATHVIVDGLDAVLSADMTASERGALVLKSLIGAGIIIGTELIEQKIHAVVAACLPRAASKTVDVLTGLLIALGTTAALFVVSKTVDGALSVEGSKRRQEIEHQLEQLTGREINDRHLTLFRAKVAVVATRVGGAA